MTNADLGGAPRVVTELSLRAVRDGHICGAASVPEGPFWEHLDPRVEKLPLRHLRRAISPFQDLLAIGEIAQLYRSWKPDIVHLHSSKIGVLGRLAALLSPATVIYTVHGFDTILKSHREFLLLERLLSRRCPAVVPVSEYDRANMERVGIRNLTQCIQNGVSDRRSGDVGDEKIARRLEDARDSGARVLLTIARREPPKRYDLFLEVARRFSKEDARFFWVGNAAPVDETSLPDNVEVLGEVAEAGFLANECDIFLLLSDYEGLPMSILEAMSCGKPIAASAVGGIPEAVSSDVGILVPNEAEGIASELGTLFANTAMTRSMGRSARERYEKCFSADLMWRNYAMLYQKCRDSRRTLRFLPTMIYFHYL